MERRWNTNIYGVPFNMSTKDAVWQKGRVIPGKNPNQRRKDACGHEIDYSAYGDTNSRYGWEIDHIRPVARNGSDDISNLQPLYWETNRNKADTYPWECR